MKEQHREDTHSRNILWQGANEGEATSGISRRRALTLGPLVPALGLSTLSCATAIGTGAITRADPRDFGAVGDGRTDDTAALQAALDASPCVELSHGVYRTTAPLRVDGGQLLLGCGSTLRGAGDHAGIRRGRDPRFGERFIEFPAVRDLHLEGFSVGLDAEGMSWGDFRGLRASRCGIGYRLATGRHGTCYYNTFTSCHVGADVDVGLLFEGTRNERFRDPVTGEVPVVGANGNLFQGCKLGGESTCVDVHAPVTNLVFTACSIERGLPGITLLSLGTVNDAGATSPRKAIKVAFFGCHFEGGGDVDGVFEGGFLQVGRFAEDSSFVGSSISGGVRVEDEGSLTNWLPLQGRGGLHQVFGLRATNVQARSILAHDVEERPTVRIDGSAHSLSLRDRDGTNRITLEGVAGRVSAERARFRSAVAIDPAGIPRLELDGPDAAVRVGNGVRDGRAGRIEVRNGAGDDTIVLDGETGQVAMENADCAEDFEIAPGKPAEPGDVMVIAAGGRLERCSRAYDRRVAGILSGAGAEKPGILLARRPGAQGENRRAVALSGRVLCRVDARFGSVETGDLLTTSSTAGHARKATDPEHSSGAVIGKALGSLRRGRELIPVLVALQ